MGSPFPDYLTTPRYPQNANASFGCEGEKCFLSLSVCPMDAGVYVVCVMSCVPEGSEQIFWSSCFVSLSLPSISHFDEKCSTEDLLIHQHIQWFLAFYFCSVIDFLFCCLKTCGSYSLGHMWGTWSLPLQLHKCSLQVETSAGENRALGVSHVVGVLHC